MQPDSIAAATTPGFGFGSFTVVDVETSGFSAVDHRVLSIAALTLDDDGAVAREFHTLVDPGCDPGPVHVHGLTRELLNGAPRFEHIEEDLTELLAGRVMVAHNARFDHDFLAAEFDRIGVAPPIDHRLCTLALARRIALPVPNCQLATLATYYGIRQQHAHDALDDARVLAAVLRSLITDAAGLGITLPLLACSPDTRPRNRRRPSTTPKTLCAFEYPGRLTDDGLLVQGMKVAFTGDTLLDRAELIARAVAAGLDVTGSVSGRTSLLVTNTPHSSTGKAAAARRHGTPIRTEATFLSLLERVRTGTVKGTSSTDVKTGRHAPAERKGPLAGKRVLVLGGPYPVAAEARKRITELGGSAAVNMSANVSDILALADTQSDPRLRRAAERGIAVHGPELLDAPHIPSSPAPACEIAEPHIMSRGQVIDLPVKLLGEEWSIRVSWNHGESYEVDVVGFLLDNREKVGTDSDFVFYNQPATDGLRLTIDGPSEQSVELTLDQLAQGCVRVVLAAVLDGTGTTFGAVGAIEIEISAGNQSGVFARATLDAATEERTLLLAEIYLREDMWRLRAIGQGYPSRLLELARSYGVDITAE